MSIRETLNRNPALVVLIAVVALAICVWIAWRQVGSSAPAAPNTAYFTVDEGKTLFTAPASTLAPFDRDGQQAVKAYVYRCSDGTQLVAYLERFTEKGKAVTEKFRAEQKAKPGQPPPSLGELLAVGRGATEIKRPGDKQWVSSATGANRMFIEELKCKSGDRPSMLQP